MAIANRARMFIPSRFLVIYKSALRDCLSESLPCSCGSRFDKRESLVHAQERRFEVFVRSGSADDSQGERAYPIGGEQKSTAGPMIVTVGEHVPSNTCSSL